jgi:hypothetical protein
MFFFNLWLTAAVPLAAKSPAAEASRVAARARERSRSTRETWRCAHRRQSARKTPGFRGQRRARRRLGAGVALRCGRCRVAAEAQEVQGARRGAAGLGPCLYRRGADRGHACRGAAAAMALLGRCALAGLAAGRRVGSGPRARPNPVG